MSVVLLARYWWLRSPNPSNANNVRNVNTDGSLSNNNANNSNGVAVDCEKSPFKVDFSRNLCNSHKEHYTHLERGNKSQ